MITEPHKDGEQLGLPHRSFYIYGNNLVAIDSIAAITDSGRVFLKDGRDFNTLHRVIPDIAETVGRDVSEASQSLQQSLVKSGIAPEKFFRFIIKQLVDPKFVEDLRLTVSRY